MQLLHLLASHHVVIGLKLRLCAIGIVALHATHDMLCANGATMVLMPQKKNLAYVGHAQTAARFVQSSAFVRILRIRAFYCEWCRCDFAAQRNFVTNSEPSKALGTTKNSIFL
jgi:hypothetical protein